MRSISLLILGQVLFACGSTPAPGPVEQLADEYWTLTATENAFIEQKPHQMALDQDIEFDFERMPIDLVPPGRDPTSGTNVHVRDHGSIYWVSSQAPRRDLKDNNSPEAYEVFLSQLQVFRKTKGTATLKLTISQMTSELLDSHTTNPTPQECPEMLDILSPSIDDACQGVLLGSLSFVVNAAAVKNDVHLAHGGLKTNLSGWINHWRHSFFLSDAFSDLVFEKQPASQFEDDVEHHVGEHSRLRLSETVVIDIPLDAVDDNEEFTVSVEVSAGSVNRRGGDAFAGAWFHDPQKTVGASYEGDGVELVEVQPNTPLPAPPEPEQVPAPNCPTATDPAAGTLQFTAPNFFVSERDLRGAFVLVSREGGTKGVVSALFTMEDGTAHAGTDYTGTSTLVRFFDGESGTRFIQIPVLNNSTIEDLRIAHLVLSDARGCAALGAQSTATLSILDDDHVPPPPDTFSIGGTVTGLTGSGLVLRDVFGGTVSPSGDGPFAFPDKRLSGTHYDVRVDTNPSNPAESCVVTNGTGQVSSADITNIAVTCSVVQNPGSLDSTFGTAGKAFSGIPGAPTAMALQTDGRVLLVGQLKLVRLNTNGTLDGGFGSSGQAAVPFTGGVFDTALGLAVQTDGKIVVVGFSSVAGQDDFALTRFNPDGTLDIGFGTNGKVTTDFAGSSDQARRVVVQSDGKLVVGGFSVSGTGVSTDTDFAIARYATDGSLDTGFGSGGKVHVNIGGKFDSAQGLALQSDGKIVAVGRVAVDGGSDPDMGMVRLNADGTLDTGFGSGGKVQTDFGRGGWEEAFDVQVQPDGKLVLAGRVQVAGLFNFAVARFTGGGVPDSGFGSGGLAVTSFTTQGDTAKAVAVQADGSIVVAGQSGNSSANPNMAVVRYQSDGTPDSNFGASGTGTLQIDFFGGIDGAEGVALQADGKIVVGGFARNGATTAFAAARILP